MWVVIFHRGIFCQKKKVITYISKFNVILNHHEMKWDHDDEKKTYRKRRKENVIMTMTLDELS